VSQSALPRRRSFADLVSRLPLPKVTFWRALAAAVIGVGLVSMIRRFALGLGATTNLTDQYPWGLWVGVKLCGVAFAGGGFAITAAIYLFGVERLRPIARPAVLVAGLGYSCFIASLIMDLGKPYNVWHPMVLWNHHSVMFEVAWCVMLYTTVLSLEFSPVIFERLGWSRAYHTAKKFTIPLVLAGLMLSMMHQSSLGSMYLIVPNRLHPLWYSSGLPIFFFVSSIAAGLSMLTFAFFLAHRILGRRLRRDILQSLAKASVVVLGVYFVMKVFDLLYRGQLGAIVASGIEGPLFLGEMLLGVLIPMILLARSAVRNSKNGLYYTSILVILGMVLNRMNVGVTGFEKSSGVHYFPSFEELSIAAMVVTVGFVVFGLAAKHLPIFPEDYRRNSRLEHH
jgi:Ni/Fe-hydrogenase subunit HybB-like protein